MDCHGPLTKWWCNCRGKRTSWQGHPKKEFSKSSLFWNDVLNFFPRKISVQHDMTYIPPLFNHFSLGMIETWKLMCEIWVSMSSIPFPSFQDWSRSPRRHVPFRWPKPLPKVDGFQFRSMKPFQTWAVILFPVLVVQFLVSKAMILIECKYNVIKYLGSRRGYFI